MASFARISSRITAVNAALTAGIALAPAASVQSEQRTDLSDLFTDQVVTGTLRLDGTVARLTNLQSITQVVDELGRASAPPAPWPCEAAPATASSPTTPAA